MASNSVIFKTLFELSILHGYFLNSGETQYTDLEADKQKKIVKNYSFESFIEIVPSHETIQFLKNRRSIFSKKSDKILVGVPISNSDPTLPFIDIALDAELVFLIKLKDIFFENYTDISFTSNRIFYFSNVKPATEPASFKTISLLGDSIFVSEDYKATEATTTDLLETLTEKEKLGVIGMISLKMTGDTIDLNVLDGSKKFIFPTPKFKIHFNNRKTYWKYFLTNANLSVETLAEKPLAKNGFVEILPSDFDLFLFTPDEITTVSTYKYPNPSIRSIKKVVSKIYSEIFI